MTDTNDEINAAIDALEALCRDPNEEWKCPKSGSIIHIASGLTLWAKGPDEGYPPVPRCSIEVYNTITAAIDGPGYFGIRMDVPEHRYDGLLEAMQVVEARLPKQSRNPARDVLDIIQYVAIRKRFLSMS